MCIHSMIYPYENCEGYKLYGDDFLPIYGLCMEYGDVRTFIEKDTRKFRHIILRLGSTLEEEEREAYTLIYQDLSHKLQVLHDQRIKLEHEIGISFDQLLLDTIANNNGPVRHESNRNHSSKSGNRSKTRKH